MILSQHVEVGVATRVLAEDLEGLGYLVKDRVTDLEEFLGALERVADGGTALDPQVVGRLLAATHAPGPLQGLTAREREVLELVAEGLSNQSIAERLEITLRSAEKYVSSIFAKFGLDATGTGHRRVLAVLRYLQG
jgi:DNA-binding NarL/FixJ family response regulator